MSTNPVYMQCGLRMRSEVEVALPVAANFDVGVDVEVWWGTDIENSAEPPPGEVIAAFGEGEGAWYKVTETDSGYLVRFRECGEFVISAGLDQIEVRPDAAGRHELLPILLAGTVSAILLTLRGNTVLHASAVSVDGRSLAFVGQSGRGKSTVAALMCVAGARLVTDDVLVVDPGPDATCIGGAPELRLREKAAEIAQMGPNANARKTKDDRIAFAPEVAAPVRLPLGAIVIPEPSQSVTRVDAERMTPSDALIALLSFPRVHRWRKPEVLTREFATLSRLVGTVPVYRATIPWGPPFSKEIAPALADLVRVRQEEPVSSREG